ncbi:MAG: polyribonucleotide nucleotidyltransferase [bacterium]
MPQLEFDFYSRKMIFETGTYAKQADGSAWIQYGDSVVLVTACFEEKEHDLDFFPLTVDYRERSYASGRIPGGFFKREGRPRDKEILTSRLIDRPIRPLFPDNYKYETQIMATVLSADREFDPDILAINGASLALCLSRIPFSGPIAAVRVSRIKDQFIINPSFSEIEQGDLSIVVAGNKSRITTLEGVALELNEQDTLKAISFAQKAILELIEKQEELVKIAGKEKIPVPDLVELPGQLEQELFTKYSQMIIDTSEQTKTKQQRSQAMQLIVDQACDQLTEDQQEFEPQVKQFIKNLWKESWHQRLQQQGLRPDDRDPQQVRDIAIEVGMLPRVHGSAVFTRGQTQCLATITLGTPADEQRMEEIEGDLSKSFMLHYNFPPFSVNDVSPNRGPGRREIGHGYLAERALANVVPPEDTFPYTVRIVTDILESNGSSSMASVCAGSLALMDAGVPIKQHVSGIALGLVSGNKDFPEDIILTDIAGEEDFEGDMDLKIAGTDKGIYAVQMDTKIQGITPELLEKAFQQGLKARIEILNKMKQAIAQPRPQLSKTAPRLHSIQIPPEKIGLLIGPSGKTVRGIQDKTGADISINDDGKVVVSAENEKQAQQALDIIENLVREAKVGEIYDGKVARITNFGAFVEIFPGKEGLLHISEIDWNRTNKVEDVLKVGDEVKVKCIEIDKMGRINLSRKVLLPKDK